MANTLAPSGFHPVRRLGGAPPNYAVLTRFIAYNNAHQIGFGDPVMLLNSGYVDLMTSGGTSIDGIFLGCEYFDPNNPTQPPFRPAWLAPTLAAGTLVKAKIIADPDVILQCQISGGPITQGNVGQNIDVMSGSPAPAMTSGRSTLALNAASAANTATLPFRIVGIVGAPNVQLGGPAINFLYDPTQSNNWVEVAMNTQDFTQAAGI